MSTEEHRDKETPSKSSVGINKVSDTMERRRAAREDARVIGGLRSQRFRSSAEKFITRSTYGLLYAAIILVCLFWGRVPTMFLVSAMSWLCGSEFYRMARLGGRMPNEFIGLAAAALYPLAALVSVEGQTGVTLLLMLAAGTWYVLTPRASISDAAITVFGAAYTGLLFSSVVVIRASYLGTEGALLTLGVMGSVWVNDATAYIFGSQFGKHKMAPRISPNKSWEGFVGGLLGSCLTWIALYALNVCGISLLLALIGGLVCGVSGVIGDLFESRLKRAVGVKDSGNLIPGHGGLLDRSDSMLFATMTAYFVLHIGGIL